MKAKTIFTVVFLLKALILGLVALFLKVGMGVLTYLYKRFIKKENTVVDVAELLDKNFRKGSLL